MSGFNILLAEDNMGDILLVKEALATHQIPHQLHVVRDGGEALTFVSRIGEPGGTACPDIVLLDLNLPKVDGSVVLAEFRKHPLCVHTPVIVITSSDAPKDRARVGALGVAYYFRKPSDLDAFLTLGSVVKQFLDRGDREKR
jgi:CheY-like chemotaxis protein